MTQRAKLISTVTGKEVVLDPANKELLIKNGVLAGHSFKVGEIIYPSEEFPDGLIKSKLTGMGWQQLIPSVFDLRIEVADTSDDTPAT